MCGAGLGCLPVLLLTVSILSIIMTYLTATFNGHVDALFPYISDTGVAIPERCIFSQFLNITALLAMINIYCRYKHVQTFYLPSQSNGLLNPQPRNMNIACLVIGFLCSLGISMVANFQEDTMRWCHFSGALMVFVFGVVYTIMDTIVSYVLCSTTSNRTTVLKIRFVISSINLALLITTITAYFISKLQSPEHAQDNKHWTHSERGYVAHLVSTFGEWVLIIAFLSYFCTFIRDFHSMMLKIEAQVSVPYIDLGFSTSQPGSPTSIELPTRNIRTPLIS